ncbi:MAG: hypothetical protein IJB60_03790 [Bacteroidaceae bacterium]|nr:hypothetical protein [Bacteroidaceae bacterium]
MKTTSNFLAVFMFAVSAFGFVSCSDDNNGGGSPSGEFLEITIDEKTTTTILESTSVSSSGEFSFIYSGDVDGVDFMLTTYRNLDKLASSSTGEYRFCPSDEPQNLDFDICVYNEDYDYTLCKNGTHTVTSIKRSGEEVIVEGKFDGVLSDNRAISGKYRLTVY